MTPLPGVLGGNELVAWRLDTDGHRSGWDSGEGARVHGGRWNSPGNRLVYCSVDPATAILEVAVHKGFRILDTVPHVLTSARIMAPDRAHVVQPTAIPDPTWLQPGPPTATQQAFGDALLKDHPLILIPSAVSTRSWSLLFEPVACFGSYALIGQQAFVLDPRLHPPRRTRPR